MDPEWSERPHRWGVACTRTFMLAFGTASSVARVWVLAAALLPLSPEARLFGFAAIPAYVDRAQLAKRWSCRRVQS